MSLIGAVILVPPFAAAGRRGRAETVHLVYLNGDPAAADVHYVRSQDGAETFSRPIRVNSRPGSAVARGTVRGAHIAVGKDGRVHIAWMGSEKVSEGGPPMLYARSNEEGGFEAERNLMQLTSGLDGRGSVAADRSGNVYILWHGVAPGEKGGTNRRVWVTDPRMTERHSLAKRRCDTQATLAIMRSEA